MHPPRTINEYIELFTVELLESKEMHEKAHLELHKGTRRRHTVYTTSERTGDKRINKERTCRRAPPREERHEGAYNVRGRPGNALGTFSIPFSYMPMVPHLHYPASI